MEKNRPVMVPYTVAAKFHANKFHANKKDQEVKKLMPQMDAAYRIPRRAAAVASKMEDWKECKKEGINNGNNKGKKKKGKYQCQCQSSASASTSTSC